VAVAEADEPRQQFCHERLFKISIHVAAKKVEAEHIEAATSVLVAEHAAKKAAMRLAGEPIPRSRDRLKKEVHDEALALRVEAMQQKKCNTLMLREACAVVDGKPNAMLSQLVRIARTNLSPLTSPGPILWGVKCGCVGAAHHLPNCWKNVEDIYWFLHRKFAHQYVHQMWLEGAFNIMDHNQANTGNDLCESKLLNKMNNLGQVKVDAEEVRRVAAEIKAKKTEARMDLVTRKLNVLNIYTCEPTAQRKKKIT